jgi:hypothetical protein
MSVSRAALVPPPEVVAAGGGVAVLAAGGARLTRHPVLDEDRVRFAHWLDFQRAVLAETCKFFLSFY